MNNKGKIIKFISGSLLIAVLTPIILFSIPQKTNAQLGPCVTALGPCASEATSWISKFLNGTTAAQTTISATFDGKQWAAEILRQVLRAFARRLLAQMTQSTVNWINSGFHGSPLFLERPGAFFDDIAKYEIRNLIQTIGYDSRRYPFGKSLATGVIESYKRQFEINAQHSLNNVIYDPELFRNYRNDFNTGGWDIFLINTQYQQNNYLGARIMTANKLGELLNDTTQNNAQKVKEKLDQGMGFLSPQTCPSNPNYNSLKNQFQQPVYPIAEYYRGNRYDPPFPLLDEEAAGENNDELLANQRYDTAYQQRLADAKAIWNINNGCPGGLVSTTPGSVVGAQIMKAITGPYDQTSLAAAMGNSLSAIFDALLNKFMSSGLTALTTRRNNTNNNNDNNFNYYGHTLGSPANTGNNNSGFDWNGPDEEIILSNFKRDVQNAIDKANQETKLIDNNDSINPGFLQRFEALLPKTQELDMCLPGPNIGWQNRLENEVSSRIADQLVSNSIREIANAFKTWLENKIKNELPGSVSYLNMVNSVKKMSEQSNNLTNRVSVIIETLIKLESMKKELDLITTQPARGSEAENTMIRLRQRFNDMIPDLSSTATVNEAQNAVNDAKDKLTIINTFIPKCTTERTVKGWSNPGGESSLLNNLETEKYLFCSSFVNTAINCNTIYQTSITDYRVSTISTDSSNAVNTPSTPVSSGNTENTGNCRNGIVNLPYLTQVACNQLNGTWTANQ